MIALMIARAKNVSASSRMIGKFDVVSVDGVPMKIVEVVFIPNAVALPD